MKDLCLHILDIIQNSLQAGADLIKVIIKEEIICNRLIIIIKDNGQGMSLNEIEKVKDPFTTSRTTREVGLGLPLLEQAAICCGGNLKISSKPGQGCIVKADFIYDHIDRAPLGDPINMLVNQIAVNPEVDFIYSHSVNGNGFEFTTREIKKELDGVRINHPEVRQWMREYLEESLSNISGGE